jgi:hypothetical protein
MLFSTVVRLLLGHSKRDAHIPRNSSGATPVSSVKRTASAITTEGLASLVMVTYPDWPAVKLKIPKVFHWLPPERWSTASGVDPPL